MENADMKENSHPSVASPLLLASRLSEFWSPRIIAELDDNFVKIARLKGTLSWHSHDDEDELFYILQGSMQIEYENEMIDLATGDLHIVPRGTPHNPIAREECLVLLIERKSTLHTGNEVTEKTRPIEEQLEGYRSNQENSAENPS